MAATATLLTRNIQGESLNAATDRLVNELAFNEGVVNVAGNSFQVLQNLGTDMNVKIGSGTAFDRAVVKGDLAGQGTFVPEHQNATQVLAVAASDPTDDRIDNVILRVFDDTFDSSTFDYADIEVTTGTADPTPVAPAVPSTAILLAEILVQNAVTQIVNGDITDKRAEYSLKVNQAFTGWQLVKSADQDDTGTHDVTWETEEIDTDGFHSGSDAIITIPAGKAGTYHVQFSIQVTGQSVTTAVHFALIKNSTAIAAVREDYSTTSGAVQGQVQISQFVVLAVGDTLKVELLNGTDTNIEWQHSGYANIPATWFSGHLLHSPL